MNAFCACMGKSLGVGGSSVFNSRAAVSVCPRVEHGGME